LARIIENKDQVAAGNWLHDLTAGSGSFDEFTSDMLAASGGGVHMLGDAAGVAEQLRAVYESGVDAVMLTFQHYEEDLQRFAHEVLPLLKRMGVVAQ
jgi:alkanesulfonate monooxygenase SsuD/methylene tetrahydromethanopterin reductase-like flavin-dependent oxidoreductase (luciferase family)